jgi:hypothetical protein
VEVDEMQIGLAIRAVQADDEVKRRRILHGDTCGLRFVFLSSRRLDRATPI